jgi:hypothetical protein
MKDMEESISNVPFSDEIFNIPNDAKNNVKDLH